jgi:hypothetical protein
MRRVVVTGMGIVSSIGNNTNEVLASLREAKSGVTAAPEYAELGFRCQVHAPPRIDWEAMVDRRAARFLAQGTAFGHIAMEQAIADSGLEESDVSNERTGLIVGSGGPSTQAIIQAAEITKEKGPKRIGPFAVPKAMSSGPSAVLATWFKIRGLNFSISSACATSTHCIGSAYEQIAMGKQDVIFAGGTEELDWSLSNLFDAMGAMSSKFNDTPEKASRAYDADRDGFVIAGGAGIVVLEEYERAKAHGRSLGRRRGALHAPGQRRQSHHRLPQSARHRHAGGRHQGDGGGPQRLRRQGPADLLDQEPDRPQPGRGGRTGGDLLPADAEQRLRRRERPHREPRSGVRGHADRPQAPRPRRDDGDEQLVRLRRHERLPGDGEGLSSAL